MSNYPVLPIVTTPEGFEYAEGHNLLTKIPDEWWIPGEGTNKTINRKTLFLKDYEFNEYKALSLQIEFEVEGATKGTIYLQSPSNGVWNSNDAKWFPPITQNAMSSSMSLASLNGKITKIVKENYRLSADWLERAYANGQRGEMCLNFRVDNTNPETKIRFRNVMLEYGPKAHPYRPNPADMVGGGLPMSIIARGLPLTVRNSIDEAIQNTASQLEQRLSTSIAQTGESIKNEVSQQYYAKGDTDKLIAEASTILEQKYNSFEMSFNSFKQMVDSNQNLTNQEFATITKFIRFIDGNIFLGENGNNQMLKIAKDRISFLQGQAEVAYISDSTLFIYDGVFLNSLRIGNFAFAPRANGSLDFKKVR